MRAPAPALAAATLFLAALALASCEGPPDRARLVDPATTRVDFVDVAAPPSPRRTPGAVPPGPAPAQPTAPPAPAAILPLALRPQAITQATSACGTGQDGLVATIAYRALRDQRSDDVLLTLRSDNGYIYLDHQRNGQVLGAVRVDVVMGSAPALPQLTPGRELETAYLMAELPSPTMFAVVAATEQCLHHGIDGQVTRDGETYHYQPSCDFPHAALTSLLGAVMESAAAACCASAPGNTSCDACQAGAQAANTRFDQPLDPSQRQQCPRADQGDESF